MRLEHWCINDNGYRSTQRQTCPVPLRLPQIPHGLAWDQNQTFVTDWQLRACALQTPPYYHTVICTYRLHNKNVTAWTMGEKIQGVHVVMATKFFTVVPKIFGGLWNLLHITLRSPKILRWL
jgi:hypothetical protein